MTQCHETECNFLWKIENFGLCTIQNRHYIKSPVFVSRVVKDTAWRLLICLEGQDSEEEYFAVRLEKTNRDARRNFSQEVFFEVALVNSFGRTAYTQKSKSDLMRFANITFPKFIKRSDVFDAGFYLLKKGVLKVKGRIWKNSSRRESSENVLIRSTLCMEKIRTRFMINPEVPAQSFKINSYLVPDGFILTCLRSEIDPGAPISETPPPRITITPVNEKSCKTYMTARISLEGRPQQPSCQLEGSTHFESEYGKTWYLPRFRRPFDAFCYYHSYHMDLDCDLSVSNLDKESVWERRYTDLYDQVQDAENALSRNILVNDLRPLLKDPTFSDITVQVGTVRIPSHRLVLSARSLILYKLLTEAEKVRISPWRKFIQFLTSFFRRATTETQGESSLRVAVGESGVSLSESDGQLSIVFSDIEEHLVRKIVSFMYTDDLGCVDHDTVILLMFASKRYQIPGLFYACASWLQTNTTITIENSCRTLAASHLLRFNDLKEKILSFINGHMECVLSYLDSLRFDDEDKKNAKYLGLVRGESRNTQWFPYAAAVQSN